MLLVDCCPLYACGKNVFYFILLFVHINAHTLTADLQKSPCWGQVTFNWWVKGRKVDIVPRLVNLWRFCKADLTGSGRITVSAAIRLLLLQLQYNWLKGVSSMQGRSSCFFIETSCEIWAQTSHYHSVLICDVFKRAFWNRFTSSKGDLNTLPAVSTWLVEMYFPKVFL